MKKTFLRHWSFTLTGPILALLLIIFWAFNQRFLSFNKGPVIALFENPILTFGLIILGAFFSSFLSGDFDVKTPVTYEPVFFGFFGGIIMGCGAVLASMSVHSIVLFNLAGIFNLTAFMITKGWIYALCMIAGGFVGSKLFSRLILKTKRLKVNFLMSKALSNARNQEIFFFVLLGLFVLFVSAVALFSVLSVQEKMAFFFGIILLVLFGVVVERGTICMSSMLKEWFLAHSAYVWRSVLFTIMCLAFFYQAGLRLSLYPQIQMEPYIQNVGFLMAGSFIMGIGFIFADGCFIGSLWKAGQGNIINIAGIFGIVIGIGASQYGVRSLMAVSKGNAATSGIPNYLNTMVSPLVFLVSLWAIGVLLLVTITHKYYRY